MLAGIRVVDLGSFITAPLAAMMLGDLGAEVIKVERPEGDPFRGSHGGRYGAAFLAFNRNKRSVVLDTGKPADQKRLAKLVATADVLIDNFRPGVLERIGLEPEALAKRRPRLVHCSITGFGATGPYRDRPAFDHVGQALSGIMSLMVDPARPEAFGPTISDNVAAMYACNGILAALVERGQTGRGRRIEVNMLESSMAFIQDIYMSFTRTGTVSGKLERVARSNAFVVACADGRMLGFHLSTTEKFWRELVAALDAKELGADERFATHQARVRHYRALADELQARFRRLTREDWMARLARTDVPFAPVNTVADVLEDPQVKALRTLMRMEHAVEGQVEAIECPLLVDGLRPRLDPHPPPMLGEHTEEVLASLAGRTRAQPAATPKVRRPRKRNT